ncbi:hypothetical protein BD626DRAFT_567965 [Schizophyllum amplum]|uniref:Carrier domain-containing protein n=1 Tax=Schizophyllum amplum TaxID=97359 RepID=A0A550CK26_9AGAR|nr:hypothetical protein BD626DRAFT_567965 [Auriculariopsis ampla]
MNVDMTCAQAVEATTLALKEHAKCPPSNKISLDTVLYSEDFGSVHFNSSSWDTFSFAISFDGPSSCVFAGDARLYSPKNVACIADTVLDALDIISRFPTTTIADFVFSNTLQRLANVGISTAPPVSPSYKETTLRDAFRHAVKTYPTVVALTDGDEDLTYTEFDILTDMLADMISEAFSEHRDANSIATCIPSSPLAIIVFYAIIKYGAAYVPLDVRSPEARLKMLLADCGAAMLITSAASPIMEGLSLRTLDVTDFIDKAKSRIPDWRASARSLWRARPSDLAYVMYTSGSTGIPKGVCMSASAVLSLAYDRGMARIVPGMRVAQISNLAWDGSVFDVWCTLTVGATLVCFSTYDVLEPTRLADLFRNRRVDATFIATSLFRHALITAPRLFADLRLVVVGGELLDFVQCRRFREVNKHGELVNGYGPTETCFVAVAHKIDRTLEQGPVPIGRPFKHTQCVVLDARGHLVPPGIPGELYIGGRGVGSGYLNRPAETAAAFIRMSIPGLDQAPSIFYRTGDVVRWLPSGDMQFERRLQAGQVKIRGQRFELAEVEAAIISTGLANDVSVSYVKPVDGRPPYLAAFMVPENENDSALTLAALTRAMKGVVAAYMIPHALYIRGSLPLNNNGKLDRRTLDSEALEHDGHAQADTPRLSPVHSAPKDGDHSTESRICAIFSEILGGRRIDVTDDFLDVGGHSLLAMQLKWRLDKELGVFVTMRDIFQGATAQRFAELFARRKADATRSIADVASTLPDANLREYPLSACSRWQYSVSRSVLAEDAVSHTPFWLRLSGDLNEAFLESALQDIVRRQDILRTVFDEVDGHPRARVLDRLPSLQVIDVPQDLTGDALNTLFRHHASRPFDIALEPPFRPILFRLTPQKRVLLLSLDHLVTDGYSEDIIFKELREMYAAICDGRTAALPDLVVTCADVARWEHSEHFAALIAPQLGYWTSQLQGCSPAAFEPDLPRADPGTSAIAGASVPIVLSEQLVERLDIACGAAGATFAMALMAVLRVVHFRRTGSLDAVLGGATANRQRAELAHLQGMFATALLYRIRIVPGQSFRDLLQQTRDLAAEGMANTDAHMATILEALWERGAVPEGSVPLRVAMGYVVHDATSAQAGNVKMERMEVNMHVVQFDMEIYFDRINGTDKITGQINYRRDLYGSAYMEGIAADVEHILAEFAETSDFTVEG